MSKSVAGLAAVEKVRQRLRAAGLRCTEARLRVMQHLIEVSQPLTHAEVADALRLAGFDQATIYRNLIELTEAGLVSRMELGDHVWRFELQRPGNAHQGEHPHFVCVDCGEVKCLPSVSVDIKSASGGRNQRIGKVTEILLKGHCEQCS